MAYNLSNILSEHNLEGLNADFSQEEIEGVIRNLPNNHALGPDGFNGLSLKNVGALLKRTLSDCSKIFAVKALT